MTLDSKIKNPRRRPRPLSERMAMGSRRVQNKMLSLLVDAPSPQGRSAGVEEVAEWFEQVVAELDAGPVELVH